MIAQAVVTNRVNELVTFLQNLGGAEHRAIVLHHLLHLQAQLRRGCIARGVAELIEARERAVGGILRQIRVAVPGMQNFGTAHGRRAAEHHQVDQRVRAQAICAVYGHAGRFPERHQTGHHEIVVAALLGQCLAMIVRGNTAHIVMHGRNDRDRIGCDVDPGEDARGF